MPKALGSTTGGVELSELSILLLSDEPVEQALINAMDIAMKRIYPVLHIFCLFVSKIVAKMNMFQWLAILFWMNSSIQEGQVLKVNITGVSDAKGQMVLAIFNNEEGFLKEDIAHKYYSLKSTKCIVEFRDLKDGKYALSVFQDLNMNGELDTNFFGIPTEPYGFSNNAMGTFGPPNFTKASFNYPETREISIALR